MRKTKKITVKETKELTVDILCNNCGESCLAGSIGQEDKAYEGLLEAEVHGGYFSSKLGDMTSYRFSICERCLVKMFSKFKIPVEIKDEATEGKYIPKSKHEQAKVKHKKIMDAYEKKLKK